MVKMNPMKIKEPQGSFLVLMARHLPKCLCYHIAEEAI